MDGQFRVTALSPTVLRIEPKGPMGFEDRSTFMATGRDKFAGIDIVNSGSSGNKTTLTTSAYSVVLDFNGPAPTDKCGVVKVNTDISGGSRISSCSERARSCLPAGATQDDCCAACTPDVGCIAWIYDPNAKNCWLMSRAPSTRGASDRVTGLMPGGFSIGVSVFAAGADTATDTPIWSTDNLDAVGQNLIWPAPPAASNPVYSYAIKDYPRFFVPPWAATPIPADAKVCVYVCLILIC